MIPLDSSDRKRDGSQWRARRRPGLREGAIYPGLGRDDVAGYLWIEDGQWARCVAESDVEPAPA